jgi:hypothetical protein
VEVGAIVVNGKTLLLAAKERQGNQSVAVRMEEEEWPTAGLKISVGFVVQSSVA